MEKKIPVMSYFEKSAQNPPLIVASYLCESMLLQTADKSIAALLMSNTTRNK